MTSPARPRRAWLPISWPALLVVCLLPLIAACAAGPPSVRLPAKTKVQAASAGGARAAAATVRQSLSPRQQVVTAYLGYTAAMTDAFNSRSPAQVRQLLSPYLDAATVSTAIRSFSQAWGKNEISYGQVERHIIGVRIQGAAAWVHDCDDTSNSGLQFAGTGQIVPGTLGLPDDNLMTRLTLVRGHWVIAVQTIEDVSCTP
jgi:hypothetical protein